MGFSAAGGTVVVGLKPGNELRASFLQPRQPSGSDYTNEDETRRAAFRASNRASQEIVCLGWGSWTLERQPCELRIHPQCVLLSIGATGCSLRVAVLRPCARCARSP